MTEVNVKFEFNEDKTSCKAYFFHDGKEYKSTCDRFDKIHCQTYERCAFNRLEIMVNTMYKGMFNLKL